MRRIMCTNQLLRILIACVAFFGTAENVEQGSLTPSCVANYNRNTKLLPLRTYRYFHETLTEDGSSPDNGSLELSFRIVGGNRVSSAEVPYAVMYGDWCGGSLIAPEWVLTAAHCKETYTFVKAGSARRAEATRYNICTHFTHPLFISEKQHRYDYDFQLLLLETPVPVTASSRPIAIGSLDDVRPGDIVAVTGWGHTHYKDKMQENARRVFVPVMDQTVCRNLPHKDYHNITERMFCAGYINGTRDSCQGDSGGPAVARGKLVGLVSFGVGCAGAKRPGVYALVPWARPWIRSITGLPL